MNQTKDILTHMEEIGEITPLTALRYYGCMRLGARIWDLRKMGYEIKTRICSKNGKHYAAYSL